MKRFLQFLTWLLVCLVPASLGSLATSTNIPVWYSTLEQPSFTPPDSVFGPVWTLLYILMAVSLTLASAKKTPAAKRAVVFFCLQLIPNLLWSLVFFGMHEIGAALGVIAVLWLMIAVSIGLFWKVDRRAALLQIPYLAWVSFASVLNYAYFTLN